MLLVQEGAEQKAEAARTIRLMVLVLAAQDAGRALEQVDLCMCVWLSRSRKRTFHGQAEATAFPTYYRVHAHLPAALDTVCDP